MLYRTSAEPATPLRPRPRLNRRTLAIAAALALSGRPPAPTVRRA